MVHTTTPVLATTSCHQAHSVSAALRDHNHSGLPRSPADDTRGGLRPPTIVSSRPLVSWPPYPWSPHPQTSTQRVSAPYCIYGPPTSPPDRRCGIPDFGSLGEGERAGASMLWATRPRGVRAAISLPGPLYFCLAVHDLLTWLQSSIVVGYLDDMSMGGEQTG